MNVPRPSGAEGGSVDPRFWGPRFFRGTTYKPRTSTPEVALPGLTRRPMKHPPAQKVKVQMENGLACPGTCVDDGPVAATLQPALARELRCHRVHPAKESSVIGSHVFE